MSIELFDARMLGPLVAFLDRHGTRSETVLGRARIPGELVAEGGWITKKQAYDFTYDVVCRSGGRDAVFAAYLDFEFGNLGPIALAVKSCKTVKDSLEIAARLGSVNYEGNEYYLQIEGDITWFCYREPNVISPGQSFINDMTLTVYYHMVRTLADEDWRPEQILVRGQPMDHHHGVEAFRETQLAGHAHHTALGFPTEFLSRRVPWAHSPSEFDERDAWLLSPEGSDPVADSVYRLVASRFPDRKPPTLQQVALMVGVSPATLKRRLHSEGVTYGRLLDRLRFDSACEMLSIPEMTVREIAHTLGYSGTNNFVRSFRRMVGITPGAYRHQVISVNE